MHKKINTLLFFLATAFLVGACSPLSNRGPSPDQTTETEIEPTQSGMADMGVDSTLSSQDFAPLVAGIYEEGEVLFIHTEASDPDVASMLTDMMGGPIVVLVPELAPTTPELLAKVYVFTNGIEGHGPFGFQPDIFDSVPGDPAYRPLRAVYLVEWNSGPSPRELGSVTELLSAEANGELMVTQSGIVVNMPILSWPGGHR